MNVKCRMLGVALLVAVSLTALADSSVISYQGTLRKADGSGVADGAYTVIFSLWDAQDNGNQLWTETHAAVAVSDGLFSVQLGETVALGSLFANHSTVWLQVVADTGNGAALYVPRVPLASAPYAKQAENAANATTAGSAASASNADTAGGLHASGLAPSVHTHNGADITSGKIDNARLNTGSGNGLDADTVDAKHASELSPPGELSQFAGSAAPTGWLLCTGAAVSRTAYAALFAAIGTTYGAGDGSTTFNLPDLRGRMPLALDNMGGTAKGRVGAAQGSTLGGAAGEESHTLTVAEMPAHSHGVTDPGHSHTYRHHRPEGLCWHSANGCDLGNWLSDYTSGGSYTGISIQNAGGGAPHNNMPPYMALNYIIKY